MNAPPALPDIRRLTRRISALRRGVRLWVALRGAAIWLGALLAMLAADMLLDRWFRFDLAQRAILLAGLAAGAAWLFWRWLVRPLSKSVSDDALVMEVERVHPEARHGLIAALQLHREAAAGTLSGSPGLAGAAIEEGLRRAEGVDFGAVLDRPGGRRNAWIAAGLAGVLLLLGAGIAREGFFRTWFRRNLLLTADRWPQATILELVGVANGQIVLPRGVDHRQLVVVLPASRVRDVSVDLELETASGRTIQRMKPTGREDGREHVFVMPTLVEECRMRARGGDGMTDWAQVVLVEPPEVESLAVTGIAPAWTGRPPRRLEGSGPWTLVAGSGVRVELDSSKPLRQAVLECGGQRLLMNRAEDSPNRWSLDVPGAYQQPDGDGPDGAIARGGSWRIRLEDDRGLGNLRETSFEIRLVENESPVVRARLLGMSGLAVPEARVPILWSATDDFGVGAAAVEVRWQEEQVEAGSRREPVPGFAGGPAVEAVPESVTVFGLQPLALRPGMTVRLQMAAEDCARPEAGAGRSREFLLRIVTADELLADLIRREIEQRNVFQQAYDRQMELNARYREIIAAWQQANGLDSARREAESGLIAAGRTQRSIGVSCAAVADRFDEFLVEVANNLLDEQSGSADSGGSIKMRFENGIIGPVRAIDELLVAAAAREIDDTRRALDDPDGLAKTAAAVTVGQEQVLEAMRQVLAAMQSSENYQEAVNRLLEIRRIEQGMRRELDRSGKPPPDVFDPQPHPGDGNRP